MSAKFEDFLKKNKKEKKINKNDEKFYRKKWFLFVTIPILLVLLAGGVMAFKTGYILNKISLSDDSGIKSLFDVLPIIGKDEEMKGEGDGRINILLLGMRGAQIAGGDLLADTIMVASYKIEENKLALISIPRDLYVDVPDRNYKAKINAVHVYGEENNQHKGLENIKKVVGEVTGLPIHYAVSINFDGFKGLIDAVGGIEVYLETPFYETSQFVQGQECGIQFTLPAGVNLLNGEKALCYARARENTSDFDRAKRQQLIIKSLKDKLVSMGTLTDLGKLNEILGVVGDNVQTDMASHELSKFYEKYSSVIKDAQIYQRVFENSEEGMLMAPSDAPENAGYILIPRAGWDNYSEIHKVCDEIFQLPPQSDINPIKQYSRPQPKQTKEEDEDKKDGKEGDDEKSDKDKKKDDDEEASDKKN
ncbi:MAG: LCP family protein [Candidatus Moranbacteria bacterium]|nr:LCP family protein [Candidatus Moranbacteria bacterium]